MRNLWFAVLFISLGAAGQTAVTATITDSDSQTWNNGSWTATLVSPSGPAHGCTTATTVSGTMSGSGVLTGSLCDNSLVGPSGSTWRFTICPHASASCSQVSTPVSGATQNISSVLSGGVTAPRFAASFGAYGYADVEVATIPPPGATYYNVTTPAFRQWSGSAWATVGGAGGGCTAVGGAGTVQAATGTAGACQATTATDTGTTFTIVEPLSISGNTNAGFVSTIANGSTGTAAYVNLQLTDGITGSTFDWFVIGSGFTPSGIFTPSTAIFFADSSLTGGVGIYTGAAAPLNLGTNSVTGLTIDGTSHLTTILGGSLVGTLPIPGVDTPTPTASQAVCIKAAGPPISLGTCSTVVGAGGACTCS